MGKYPFLLILLISSINVYSQRKANWEFRFEFNTQMIPGKIQKEQNSGAYLLDSAASIYKVFNTNSGKKIYATAKPGARAGIKYNYPVGKHLDINVGLLLSNHNFELRSESFSFLTDSAELFLQPTANGLYDPSSGKYYKFMRGPGTPILTGPFAGITIPNPAYRVNLTNIDFPVGATFFIPKTRLSITAEIIPSFIVRSVVKGRNTTDEITWVDLSGKINSSLIWHGGAAFAYTFNTKLSVGLNYSYQLNRVELNDMRTKIHSAAVFLQYGLKWNK